MTGSNRRPSACKTGALPTELIPQFINGGWGWIRTNAGCKPADLQSATFGLSVTHPEPVLYSSFKTKVNALQSKWQISVLL